jgi:hypothetical protein
MTYVDRQDQVVDSFYIVESKGFVVVWVACAFFCAALLLAIVLVKQHIVLFEMKHNIRIGLFE